MSTPADEQDPEFGTFEVLRVDRPGLAAEVADVLSAAGREQARQRGGPLSARVHVALDGTVVVHHCRWATEADHRHSSQARGPIRVALRGIEARAGVGPPASWRGTRVAGIDGMSATEPPTMVAVATRHLGGPDSARAVVDILRSGEWKRHVPGFIGATAYISADSTTFVNYPQWVDEASFDAYMADPRIAEGQHELAALETAPPDFLLCRMVAEVTACPPR